MAYHPQGDGMVERFNRSLLQMLHTYVCDQADWETHLPLLLFAYHTVVHTSTGVSPFRMMYGRPSTLSSIPDSTSFEAGSYPAILSSKLAKLMDMVETVIAKEAQQQKVYYD